MSWLFVYRDVWTAASLLLALYSFNDDAAAF
jgi:hypothetical protein